MIFRLAKKIFSHYLKKDEGLLIGWHSNIAMFMYDYTNVKNYEDRNNLAQKFLKYFFGIEYDWKKLFDIEE